MPSLKDIFEDNNMNIKDINVPKRHGLSSTKKIMLGFLATICIGTVLLSLPISVAEGSPDILTSLFTATTSVCVTGLVVVDTYAHWTLFGKIIILIMIQLGGLGIVAFTSALMIITGKKVGLRGRIVIQDAYGLSSLQGLVKFVRKVIIGTLCVELFGMLCYLPTFISRFGAAKGTWYALFNAISAFCNAGIDIMGPDSLASFNSSPSVLITTMFLIFMGGIGFVVWWDILDTASACKKKKIRFRNFGKKLKLHTKLVLLVTAILLFGGALLLFILEYNNPDTIGNMSLGDKILNSLFQSVTLRTAGFFSYSQAGMSDSSTMLCLVLMIIGGSPVGTAGGIKTVTAAVLVCTVIAVIKGKNEAVIFKKSISDTLVKRSVAVIIISLCVVALFNVLLMVTNNLSLIDSSYEVCSAIGTVGLTRGITSSLNPIGRIIIIVAMYLGRIGPISLFIAFSSKYSIKNSIHYSEAKIFVG